MPANTRGKINEYEQLSFVNKRLNKLCKERINKWRMANMYSCLLMNEMRLLKYCQ